MISKKHKNNQVNGSKMSELRCVPLKKRGLGFGYGALRGRLVENGIFLLATQIDVAIRLECVFTRLMIDEAENFEVCL